jgi:hypothetical protein
LWSPVFFGGWMQIAVDSDATTVPPVVTPAKS